MAAHARLNNKFTEDEKCHNLMRWINFSEQSHVRAVLEIEVGKNKQFEVCKLLHSCKVESLS